MIISSPYRGRNISRVVRAGENVLHSIPTPTIATRGFFSEQPHTTVAAMATARNLEKYPIKAVY